MRTNYCGLLRSSDENQNVLLCGWIERIRDLGGVIFLDLRDREGIVQVTIPLGNLTETAKLLGREFVVQVQGKVVKKPTPNPKLNTGEIEVVADKLMILSEANVPPYELSETNVSEDIRLRYRYYDLRKPELQKNLRIRAKAMKAVREFYDHHDFIEIETPVLMRSTPEGARDYIVPSRIHHGSFYALPQSPQQYKQLLMVAGFDKYYQIVKCFRDEDLRSDRQPEFTQIDVEMSFVEENDVMALAEQMTRSVFQKTMQVNLPDPFPRMSYHEAMLTYGSDKPDLRFDLSIKTITSQFNNCGFQGIDSEIEKNGVVIGIKLNGMAGSSRKTTDAWQESAKKQGLAGLIQFKKLNGETTSSISKFISKDLIETIEHTMEMQETDLVLICAGLPSIVYPAMGNLRLQWATDMNLIDKSKWSPVWITEFPLLEWDRENERWSAVHHPFTSPIAEHEHLLSSDPEKVIARAYDLVLNGNEIGGGSIRNHRMNLQSMMFKSLGLSESDAKEKFGYFLEALTYGTPPHGGIAFGFDRIVALLCGVDNIRDVIAFPKTTTASSLMDGSPAPVSKKQLDELGIRLLKENYGNQ